MKECDSSVSMVADVCECGWVRGGVYELERVGMCKLSAGRMGWMLCFQAV